jgi:hypothetical protein
VTRKRRVGVIGSIVWDVIYGRDARSSPIEEWGGISYALGGMDAALPEEWEIVPIIKVGEDLAPAAAQFMGGLRRMAADGRPIVVPYPNNRVELRYFDDERRSEVMRGGVPPWTWLGLKPVLETARLDALYINFLSGWELDLETTMLIRQAFAGPMYADLHMLAWAVQPDGLRTLRPISHVREWCGCFDVLQVNEDEMRMLAADPMALAATALHAGVRCLVVTMAKRGAVYFAAADFERLALQRPDSLRPFEALASDVGPMRTSIVPADHIIEGGDPTGCGDVWGATYFSRLLAGDNFGDAILAAHRAAARNVGHRGASGLSDHLRGTISLT